MICYGKKQVNNLEIENQLGSLYYATVNLPDFPVPFFTVPAVSIYFSNNTTTNFVWASSAGTGTTSLSVTNPGSVTLWRPTKLSVSGLLSWIAIGRWK